jgi:hypothetical protein
VASDPMTASLHGLLNVLDALTLVAVGQTNRR